MFCTRKTRATKSSFAVPDTNSTSMRPYCCRPGSGQYCRHGWDRGTETTAEQSWPGSCRSHPPLHLHTCPEAPVYPLTPDTPSEDPPVCILHPSDGSTHLPVHAALTHSGQVRQTLQSGRTDTAEPLYSDAYKLTLRNTHTCMRLPSSRDRPQVTPLALHPRPLVCSLLLPSSISSQRWGVPDGVTQLSTCPRTTPWSQGPKCTPSRSQA